MRLENRDIIFVSNTLANGGAARVMCVLANEFVKRGKHVGMAIYNNFEGEYPVTRRIQKEYGPQGDSITTKLRRVLWLRAVAKRNPKACIIPFEYFVNMQTLIACLGLSNRLVVSERNDPTRVGGGWKTDFLREHLYRHADTLVCQTENAAAHFSDKVNKTIILNPVKEGLPEPYHGERRHSVACFCRLEKQKNLKMLVRAFADFSCAFSDWTLDIYGDGSERDSLIALANELGVGHKVFINPSRQDVHSLVRDAGMFVLPSDYEGLSNSMIEAMAIGLPCVCTDCPCGGARTVIRDGMNGLLVPVGGERELVDAMTRIAVEKGLAARIGLAAAGLRDELSVCVIADQWCKELDE